MQVIEDGEEEEKQSGIFGWFKKKLGRSTDLEQTLLGPGRELSLGPVYLISTLQVWCFYLP